MVNKAKDYSRGTIPYSTAFLLAQKEARKLCRSLNLLPTGKGKLWELCHRNSVKKMTRACLAAINEVAVIMPDSFKQ